LARGKREKIFNPEVPTTAKGPREENLEQGTSTKEQKVNFSLRKGEEKNIGLKRLAGENKRVKPRGGTGRRKRRKKRRTTSGRKTPLSYYLNYPEKKSKGASR